MKAVVWVCVGFAGAGLGFAMSTVVPSRGDPESRLVDAWESYHDGAIRLAEHPAPAARVLVFSDHQCPHCLRSERLLVELRDSGVPISVSYRHYPMLGFASSMAAVAMECASRQGLANEMNRALFLASDTLQDVDWWRLASGVGVGDSVAFDGCRQGEGLAAVARDLELGTELGVSGTPTVLVDSLLFVGFPDGALSTDLLRSQRRRR